MGFRSTEHGHFLYNVLINTVVKNFFQFYDVSKMSLNTHITLINFIKYSMKTFLNNEIKREESYKVYHVPPLLQTTLLTMHV